MRIPFMRSRNFNSHEIARSALDVPVEQLYLTGYIHGAAQAVRDHAFRYFGTRFKGLGVSSSNRASYNQSVPRAAENSHHVFRVEVGTLQLHAAVDFIPMGVSPYEFYVFVKTHYRGEIILEADRGVVHYAPVGMEDEAFQQS